MIRYFTVFSVSGFSWHNEVNVRADEMVYVGAVKVTDTIHIDQHLTGRFVHCVGIPDIAEPFTLVFFQWGAIYPTTNQVGSIKPVTKYRYWLILVTFYLSLSGKNIGILIDMSTGPKISFRAIWFLHQSKSALVFIN